MTKTIMVPQELIVEWGYTFELPEGNWEFMGATYEGANFKDAETGESLTVAWEDAVTLEQIDSRPLDSNDWDYAECL